MDHVLEIPVTLRQCSPVCTSPGQGRCFLFLLTPPPVGPVSTQNASMTRRPRPVKNPTSYVADSSEVRGSAARSAWFRLRAELSPQNSKDPTEDLFDVVLAEAELIDSLEVRERLDSLFDQRHRSPEPKCALE